MAKKTPIDISKLSKADARVLIAKDVISQLRRKCMIAADRLYINVRKKPRVGQLFTFDDVENNRDVRDVLRCRMESCEVCAKGAILISTIMKFDNMPVDSLFVKRIYENEDGQLVNLAAGDSSYNRYFSRRQLDLMEVAFEKNTNSHDIANDNYTKSEWQGANTLRRSGLTSRQRMTKIMENIIANKGMFKPAQFIGKFEVSDYATDDWRRLATLG